MDDIIARLDARIATQKTRDELRATMAIGKNPATIETDIDYVEAWFDDLKDARDEIVSLRTIAANNTAAQDDAVHIAVMNLRDELAAAQNAPAVDPNAEALAMVLAARERLSVNALSAAADNLNGAVHVLGGK